MAVTSQVPTHAADPAFLVKDINTSVGQNPPSSPQKPAVIGTTAYFAAEDSTSGVELWKTDGTTAGTNLVKDINPGPNGSYPAAPIELNGTLFFTADNGSNSIELWKTDGTEAGTMLV